MLIREEVGPAEVFADPNKCEIAIASFNGRTLMSRNES